MIKEVYDDLKGSRLGKVAIVLLLCGVGLFALWNSFPDSTKEKIILGESTENKSISELDGDSAESSVEPQIALEKLAAKWLAAWLNGDVDTFVNLASEPFYFDQKIILTRQQLRSEYLELQEEKGESWRQISIDSIKVQTARELEAEGYDLSTDRIFSNLNLTLDDYAITVIANGEGMLLMARQFGNDFEIVGTWD